MAHATETTTQNLSFLVSTDRIDFVDETKTRVADILDEVWIVRDMTTRYHLAQGVHSVTVRFTAPAHEVREDAPVVRKAILAASHVAPVDSVSIWT